MAKVPYHHICQRLNNGLARHLTGEKAGLPLMVRMVRTPVNLLGCDLLTFVRHMESQMHDGMTWGNFRRWHIDHIFPIVGVNVYDDTEVFAACHYRNLQPMRAADNMRKHGNVTDATIKHFRALCSEVRQPWHRLHRLHPCDAYAPPKTMTAQEILAMPEGAFAKWVADAQELAQHPRYGDFVPPTDDEVRQASAPK
jgi:hypothetical protein